MVGSDSLSNGRSATIVSVDDDWFELTPEEEDQLLVSIAQAERGEGIPAEQLLEELRARTRDFKSRTQVSR